MATFRYSHIYSENPGFTPSNTQLEKAEIGLQLAVGEEGLFFTNAAGTVVKVGIGVSYTKEETDAKYETKADAAKNYVADASYNDEDNAIEFVNASGETLATIDATPFIKDGMISAVTIDEETSELVITWNTDASTTETRIELTKIFNPANYYTKSETMSTSQIEDAIGVVGDALDTHIADMEAHVTKEKQKAWDDHKADEDIHVSATAKQNWNNHIANNDIHVTTDDKKKWDEVSGKTDNDDFTAHTENKVVHVTSDDKTNWNGHTANTEVHVEAADKTRWDNKADKNKAFGGVEYITEGSAHTIVFTAVDGTKVDEINANDFIKDGLVEKVEVVQNEDDDYVLRIKFVGIEDPTDLTLEEIFDPSNYYNKSDVDGIKTALETAIENAKKVAITGGTASYDDDQLELTLKNGNNEGVKIELDAYAETTTGILFNTKKGATDKIILSGGTF